MLRQAFHELTLATRGRGLYEFTDEVAAWLARLGCKQGLVTLHLRHTSASLLIQENADPDVRADFERFFARLVPDGDPLFEHTCEGADDMPAHVKSSLLGFSLTLPVRDGRFALGTWQGIYLCEHRDHGGARSLIATLQGE